jgi:hypothetical protein
MNISIIDALDAAAKEALLLNAIDALRSGETAPEIKIFDSQIFRRIEDCPIAHRAPRAMLSQAAKGETLSSKGIVAHQGNGAAVQYHRLRWEVPLHGIESGIWMNMAHGTPPQPFFKNTTHVFLWEKNGAQCKANICFRYPYLNGNYGFKIQAEDFYGLPGLAYGKRTNEFTCQILPAGHIFTFEGTAIHSGSCDPSSLLWATLAVLNSRAVQFWLNSVCADHKAYNYLNQVPISDQILQDKELVELAKQGVRLRMEIVSLALTSPYFVVPHALTGENASAESDRINALDNILNNIDRICSDHYIIEGELSFKTNNEADDESDNPEGEDLESEEKDGTELGDDNSPSSLNDAVDYLLGTAFGRWDIRYATGERQPPPLPDPFDPLPVCPPGMLQNADGLPAEPKDVPADYPLGISWSGILVDDENHPEDIVARVREAIEVIWQDRAEAIEQEACEILEVKAKPKEGLDALRVYFRDPNRFFKDHLGRYSKSRRKAPIYWPLSTESGSYTLWIYYHRLSDQTLFRCIEMVDLKREDVGRELETLRSRVGTGGTAQERQQMEEQSTFLTELKALRDRLHEVTRLPYHPNLNDGVQITAAPLWQCFRHGPWQKVLKETWTDLSKGKYDWAHLAMSIWPDRVEKVCEKDRSIAIAHGREDLCKVPPPKPAAKRASRKRAKDTASDDAESDLLEDD